MEVLQLDSVAQAYTAQTSKFLLWTTQYHKLDFYLKFNHLIVFDPLTFVH
jgi:hypothetical protein